MTTCTYPAQCLHFGLRVKDRHFDSTQQAELEGRVLFLPLRFAFLLAFLLALQQTRCALPRRALDFVRVIVLDCLFFRILDFALLHLGVVDAKRVEENFCAGEVVVGQQLGLEALVNIIIVPVVMYCAQIRRRRLYGRRPSATRRALLTDSLQ